MIINDGGRAFPRPSDRYGHELGMSLRDYFAAKAMQGLCADPNSAGIKRSDLAEDSYQLADAMLVARELKS